ncbi:MAG TPA: hypothetical protein P5186_01390 [Candidatus Paceibacterota bacterium]|nr:hypothetical protein [Verrucomicrobiota bacterium]HRY46675.1 hypothetical protein [Candidatus Paceibacterota bacterium]HSA03447.1 hypothetical protein [Candidatus Paceibacterota bacterium]
MPLKGALALVNAQGATTRRFDFALNPEQIHRRIHWPEAGEAPGHSAPRERLSFKLILDAMDVLQQSGENPGVLERGIRPQLAMLESFIRPLKTRPEEARSQESVDTRILAPTLVFLWGREPAIPVWMVSLNVREELFDPMLNPLRATLWLELEAMTQRSTDQTGALFD